jgi:MarR family transcriptional regulator, temperature-dependent positive regulator of motility
MINTSESQLIHLLHRASQVAESIFAKEAENLKLTPRQYIVLEAIAAHEGTTQTGIVDRTGIDRSTVADMVRRLNRQGLLARKRAKDDARAYSVKLTAQGETTLKKAREAAQRADDRLLSLLTKQNQKNLGAALAEITAKSNPD